MAVTADELVVLLDESGRSVGAALKASVHHRETPLHLGHIRLMADVTQAGAVVLPPAPGFYHRPKTIMDLVDHTITKILDQFGLDAGLIERWAGLPGVS